MCPNNDVLHSVLASPSAHCVTSSPKRYLWRRAKRERKHWNCLELDTWKESGKPLILPVIQCFNLHNPVTYSQECSLIFIDHKITSILVLHPKIESRERNTTATVSSRHNPDGYITIIVDRMDQHFISQSKITTNTCTCLQQLNNKKMTMEQVVTCSTLQMVWNFHLVMSLTPWDSEVLCEQ